MYLNIECIGHRFKDYGTDFSQKIENNNNTTTECLFEFILTFRLENRPSSPARSTEAALNLDTQLTGRTSNKTSASRSAV
jgi:hypothetical protein